MGSDPSPMGTKSDNLNGVELFISLIFRPLVAE